MSPPPCLLIGAASLLDRHYHIREFEKAIGIAGLLLPRPALATLLRGRDERSSLLEGWGEGLLRQALLVTGYSAASDIAGIGALASQESRNCFSQARSVTSCTARSAK